MRIRIQSPVNLKPSFTYCVFTLLFHLDVPLWDHVVLPYRYWISLYAVDLGAAPEPAKRGGGEGVPVPRQQEAGGRGGSLPRHILQAGQPLVLTISVVDPTQKFHKTNNKSFKLNTR